MVTGRLRCETSVEAIHEPLPEHLGPGEEMEGPDIQVQALLGQLLLSYANIEQTLRQWHPGLEWDRGKVETFAIEQEKRNHIETLLLQSLRGTPGRSAF